jgi:hypothetical protein
VERIGDEQDAMHPARPELRGHARRFFPRGVRPPDEHDGLRRDAEIARQLRAHLRLAPPVTPGLAGQDEEGRELRAMQHDAVHEAAQRRGSQPALGRELAAQHHDGIGRSQAGRCGGRPSEPGRERGEGHERRQAEGAEAEHPAEALAHAEAEGDAGLLGSSGVL